MTTKMTRDGFINNKNVDIKIILGVKKPVDGVRAEESDEYVITSNKCTKENFKKMKEDNPSYFITTFKFDEDSMLEANDLEVALQKAEAGAKFNPAQREKVEAELTVEDNNKNMKKRKPRIGI